MSILVLAGDLTNYYLFQTLKENGYSVKLEGFNHLLDLPRSKGIVLKGYKTIIAPIPLSINGQTLYSPYSEERIHIDQLFSKADLDSTIIGGPFSISDNRIYDITQNRYFTDLTVIPTCEEIIKIIIDKSNITLLDSKITILGEGRIAKRVKLLLELLGAIILTKDKIELSDVVIATAEQEFLNNYMTKLNRDTVILDVTPGENLIEYKKAKKIGLEIIKARGLPGKSAPRAVSNYLYNTLVKEKLI